MTALPAASAAAIWPVKIASGKFHGVMQAKTPRPCSASWLRSPVGPGSALGRGEIGARAQRVVAQIVDRLAHLGERRRDRLPAFADDERHQLGAMLALVEIGRAFEDRARARRPACVPGRLRRARRGRSAWSTSRRPGLDDLADLARAGRSGRVPARPAPRCSTPPMIGAARQGRRSAASSASRSARERRRIGEIDARANSCAPARRGRAAAGCADAASPAAGARRAIGSAMISSIGCSSSTMRLTKEVLAPFSSSRRTR